MHPAPALTLPLDRSPALRLTAVLACGLAVVMLGLWAGLHWPFDTPLRRGLRLLPLPAALLLGRQLLQLLAPVGGWLRWNGQHWQLLDALDTGASGRPGTLRLQLDAQRWLLLRFDPDHTPRRTRWLLLRRSALPQHWHALRCAVYSPRPASLVAPADGPEAANPPPHEHRP
jgi:hypothetical protein